MGAFRIYLHYLILLSAIVLENSQNLFKQNIVIHLQFVESIFAACDAVDMEQLSSLALRKLDTAAEWENISCSWLLFY